MSEKLDAFRQGVAPGGMFSSSRIRLLICYVLHSLKTPVSKKVITDALCETGLVNFFEVGSAVDALVKLGNLEKITEDGDEKYTVTPTGADIAETLEMDLPKSVREKSLRHALYCATIERRKTENEITVEKQDAGYHVTFHVGKGKDRILSLTLYVTDSDQVEALKKGFLDNPQELCESVFHALLKE